MQLQLAETALREQHQRIDPGCGDNDPCLASLGHDIRQPKGTFPALRVEHSVRQVFLETVSVFSADDTVIAERGLRDVSIDYTSAAASASLWDPTWITLRIHLDIEELWVGSIRVAVPFRSRGLGRQLARAAEQVAIASGIAVVHVFPMLSAQTFWRKNGYLRHACTSRVLSKHIRPVDRAVDSCATDLYGAPSAISRHSIVWAPSHASVASAAMQETRA